MRVSSVTSISSFSLQFSLLATWIGGAVMTIFSRPLEAGIIQFSIL
jgi:hypothetical protein